MTTKSELEQLSESWVRFENDALKKWENEKVTPSKMSETMLGLYDGIIFATARCKEELDEIIANMRD